MSAVSNSRPLYYKALVRAICRQTPADVLHHWTGRLNGRAQFFGGHAKLLGPVTYLVGLVKADPFWLLPFGFSRVIGHRDLLSEKCAASRPAYGMRAEAAYECRFEAREQCCVSPRR